LEKKEGSTRQGEFHDPRGLLIFENFLYVCDSMNHRIQLLNKETGQFLTESTDKNLKHPEGILLYDNLLYITDYYGLHIFTKQFSYIQGTPKELLLDPRGLCVVNEQLYVLDIKRIPVFEYRDEL